MAASASVKSPRRTSQTRKRRLSVASDNDEASSTSIADPEISVVADADSTPRKVVKRVRFSDLGPELASTGLTPFVRRATLSPSRERSLLASSTPSKSRRRSEPPALPSLSTEWSPSHHVQRIQFTPLRQTLDPRMRRRLRRSHLSEEINEVQAEKREYTRAQNELLHLRSQSQTREDTIKRLTTELELQCLFGIEVSGEGEQRIQELESEIAELRTRAAVVKDEEESPLPIAMDLPSDDAAYEEVPTEPDSPWEEETFFSSPTSRRVTDLSSPVPGSKVQETQASDHASCQVSLPDPTHIEQIQAFEEAMLRLTKESSDAKSALELIKDQLRTLGFPTDAAHGNEDITSNLQQAFRAARMQLEYLLPGETAGGTEEGSTLLSALLAHVKRLVEKVKAGQKTVDRQQQIETALRGQFNATVQRVTDVEQRLAVVDSHRSDLIRDMESKDTELDEARREIEAKVIELRKSEKQILQLEEQAEEQCTSVDRLQAALVTYREEVASLETLVTKMEKSSARKDSELANLRSQLDNAIKENEEAAHKLSKLRQDVQESAFELSTLARPELKSNVTQRRSRHREKQQSDEEKTHYILENTALSSGQQDDRLARKSGSSKRDSGIAMSDSVLETIGEEMDCAEIF